MAHGLGGLEAKPVLGTSVKINRLIVPLNAALCFQMKGFFNPKPGKAIGCYPLAETRHNS
jgi:hypothetical protein